MGITISQVSIQGETGTLNADEQLTAWAELVSDGDQQARAEVTFSIDGSPRATANAELEPFGQQWVQAQVGELAAGGHELEVSAAIDDGMSSSQATSGISFQVTVAQPETPNITMGQLALRPHSNVDHPDGTAWAGEQIAMWVQLENHGSSDADVAVSFQVDGGGWDSQNVTVPAGGDLWVHHDAPAQEVGAHNFEVWASTETADQSIVIGSDTASLNVTEANAGWGSVDVQLTLHDFRGRPMEGRAIFVQFHGQDGTVAGGAETLEGTAASGGVWTSPDVNIPPQGTMRVMAVSTGDADEPVEGSVRYRLQEGSSTLGFTVRQSFAERTITARSMRAVREQLTAEVNAGIEIEVISIGGSVATEQEETREFETSVEWTVRYGRPAFEFDADE
jgi:hypothetical protein